MDKTPHLSISKREIAQRVLNISEEEFNQWPEDIQELTISLGSELFLIRYNPFIPPLKVYHSVKERLRKEKKFIEIEYYLQIYEGLRRFWEEFKEEEAFKKEVIARLKSIIPEEHIYTSPNSLIECSTDATDLRVELPMLIVAPGSTEEIKKIVLLANEMGFYIVPRGGGSGLTGGAVPIRRKTIVMSLSRMKKILSIDKEDKILCAQTGVITLTAIEEAAKKGLLLTVDPASKAASSLGGNIAENAGGPYAFEYGTTLDNILSYKMVLPTGKLIEVKRKDHPWRKILPKEKVVFEIFDENKNLIDEIHLYGEQIRKPGLGKDVTNKYLGGLPGVQKEGVDGVITEACFTLHRKLPFSRTLCLEFFGKSMKVAMLVIKELVKLRNEIRETGDLVKISALEEFGSKYVQAIEYQKKSTKFEGDPISVLLIQLDSENKKALNEITQKVVSIAKGYENVDIFVAKDDQEAEIFWQDRHKLSAITKRTSGFKINEDVVIPIDVIPEFSDFIENLNLYYLALAYRQALQKTTQIEGIDPGDEFIDMEINFSSRILKNEISREDLGEQEFELQIHFFFQHLMNKYPEQKEKLKELREELFNTRIMIANHMHAGDGNCHVNIPVNSNDPEMLKLAHEAAKKVISKVMELNGAISGEHGIGLTKIEFQEEEKIQALKEYKKEVDPQNIFNPEKLITKQLSHTPYTFSFNKLIRDLKRSPIKLKDTLIDVLRHIQICARCGKCKQVCPMYYPEQGYLFHPRNKIISLGALIEAYYYTRVIKDRSYKKILGQIKDLVDRCTACGKCMSVCPVKINAGEQIISLRYFLEKKGTKKKFTEKIVKNLAKDPENISKTSKIISLAQDIDNKVIKLIPKGIRKKFSSPLLKAPGPDLSIRDLYQEIKDKNLFLPKDNIKDVVFYFPGCGASLFFKEIAMATIYILIKTGVAVIIPPKHMCCGYPALVSGNIDNFENHWLTLENSIKTTIENSNLKGFTASTVLTSCGTCREVLNRLESTKDLPLKDVFQYLSDNKLKLPRYNKRDMDIYIIYHPACHSEWNKVPTNKSGEIYKDNLAVLLDQKIDLSPGCCGESGFSGIALPHIYNIIRSRKKKDLENRLKNYPFNLPIIVGCPSCKVGIKRILNEEGYPHRVLHTTEVIAERMGGLEWLKELRRLIKDEISGN